MPLYYIRTFIPSIDSNKIGYEGAKALAAALAKNYTLTVLYLGTCLSIINYRGQQDWPRGSKSNWSRIISQQCAYHAGTRYIFLINWRFIVENKIGDEGATAIGTMLLENRSVRVLDLGMNLCDYFVGDNGVGNEGAKAIGAALQENDALKSLDLSNSSPYNSLSVENNNIGDTGIKEIGAALALNNTLTTLSLGIFSIELHKTRPTINREQPYWR
eukprot:TRINITY_DN1038_c0_g2_i1.p3 TRINITY_DN1038_c0_g2~~TRINITY_DN1038_c0_g2_i1.p3  ORF type:complete len:216 (-),score=5.45 TRINITY_DN1038_c0_g2_i1:1295-1942(-)